MNMHAFILLIYPVLLVHRQGQDLGHQSYSVFLFLQTQGPTQGEGQTFNSSGELPCFASVLSGNR